MAGRAGNRKMTPSERLKELHASNRPTILRSCLHLIIKDVIALLVIALFLIALYGWLPTIGGIFQ